MVPVNIEINRCCSYFTYLFCSQLLGTSQSNKVSINKASDNTKLHQRCSSIKILTTNNFTHNYTLSKLLSIINQRKYFFLLSLILFTFSFVLIANVKPHLSFLLCPIRAAWMAWFDCRNHLKLRLHLRTRIMAYAYIIMLTRRSDFDYASLNHLIRLKLLFYLGFLLEA